MSVIIHIIEVEPDSPRYRVTWPAALCGYVDRPMTAGHACISTMSYRNPHRNPHGSNKFCESCESKVSMWDMIARCNL